MRMLPCYVLLNMLYNVTRYASVSVTLSSRWAWRTGCSWVTTGQRRCGTHGPPLTDVVSELFRSRLVRTATRRSPSNCSFRCGRTTGHNVVIHSARRGPLGGQRPAPAVVLGPSRWPHTVAAASSAGDRHRSLWSGRRPSVRRTRPRSHVQRLRRLDAVAR